MNFVLMGLLKALAVLGFGFVTFTGFDAAIDALKEAVLDNWNGMAANALAIVDMAGGTDALGYMMAAVTTKAGLAATKKLLPTVAK